jgi:aldehyde:ferredoxin oxidoreductase
LGVGGKVDPLSPHGQVELSRNLQIATAAIDTSGMCLFVAFPMLDDTNASTGLCEMIAAYTGETFTGDDLVEMGKQVLRREREFNTRAGFSAVADRLPDFFRTEPLAPHQATFDVPDEELDTVFNF